MKNLLKSRIDKKRLGFYLIETVLVVSLWASLMTALTTQTLIGQKNSFTAEELHRAVFLAQEGIEGVKNIRDDRFDQLNSGVYDLARVNGIWELQPFVPLMIDGSRQRRITITAYTLPPVDYRDVVSEVVEWRGVGFTPVVKINTRFNNWFSNSFNWGMMEAGPGFDLNAQNSGSNSHDSRAVLTSGNFLFVGNKASAGKELVVLSLLDSPNLTVAGAADLAGDANQLALSGNYLYIASNTNNQELQVVDITNPAAPLPVGGFNLTNANSGNDNADGLTVAAFGAYVFLGREVNNASNFFIFDVGNQGGCSPAAPCLLSQLTLTGYPHDLKVAASGNYVYVAADDDGWPQDDGLFIRVNVTNKNVPVSDAAIALNSEETMTLAISDARAYVLTNGVDGAGVTQDELYVINIVNPQSQSPALLDSFNLGNDDFDAKDISFIPTDQQVVLLTNNSDQELQVIDVTDDYNQVPMSTFDLLGSGTTNALDWSATYTTVYVVGQVAGREIQSINPSETLNPESVQMQ